MHKVYDIVIPDAYKYSGPPNSSNMQRNKYDQG